MIKMAPNHLYSLHHPTNHTPTEETDRAPWMCVLRERQQGRPMWLEVAGTVKIQKPRLRRLTGEAGLCFLSHCANSWDAYSAENRDLRMWLQGEREQTTGSSSPVSTLPALKWDLGRGQEVCIAKQSYPGVAHTRHRPIWKGPERSCDTSFLFIT